MKATVKYEAVARAAFINTQIAVAKDIADDGKANDFPYVQIWVDGLNSKYQQTAIEKVWGSRKEVMLVQIKMAFMLLKSLYRVLQHRLIKMLHPQHFISD